MLQEVDIEKRLADFHQRFNFSLDHEYRGVFGPSGSGKSSLMNMIAGLMRPDQNTIRLSGTSLFESDVNLHRPPEQRRVSVVFQQATSFPICM